MADKHLNGYLFSDRKELLQVDVIHRFLSRSSYWAQEIPIAVVKESIQHSWCFGVYQANQQIGFARLITDYATFGYLADVFILPNFRGKGLSKHLMEFIHEQTTAKQLRRLVLVTRDAHELYKKVGFTELMFPERYMELVQNNLYKKKED